MLMRIQCPSCQTEGAFSLADPSYEGPYRCWKCRALFAVRITGTNLESCQPITEEEFQQQLQAQALQRRFRRD